MSLLLGIAIGVGALICLAVGIFGGPAVRAVLAEATTTIKADAEKAVTAAEAALAAVETKAAADLVAVKAAAATDLAAAKADAAAAQNTLATFMAQFTKPVAPVVPAAPSNT